MLLNEGIVNIEKADGLCLLTFCLLLLNFLDYFHLHKSLLLYIQDLHK